MQTRNHPEFEELYAKLKSPLAAFFEQEKKIGDQTCFVQPFADGEIKEYSWSQAADQVRRMASYLQSLQLPAGSRIALLSTNCAYWIMADLAIWLAGHISVPLYPVLTAKSIRQIMEHSEAAAMFVGKLEGWEDMQPGIDDSVIKIGFPLSPQSVCDAYPNWTEICAQQAPIENPAQRDINDIATIVYTSGTTGVPKGVVHSFRNLAVVGHMSGELYEVSSEDRKISYLPLAHVAERASVEVNQMFYGYTVYFSHSLATFADDLRRARPTILIAVPRIWLKFQQRVLEKVNNDDLQALLSDPATADNTRQGLLAALGLDQLRYGISGAAPLSTALAAWYMNLGIELLEGYGMSENFAYSHTTRSGTSKIGFVGAPSTYVDCKISERGEVLVKSPATMLGYYKAPEKTAEVLDDADYLHTGDKGEIDADGRLKLTGRISELFKTSKGKFVAPAPIENLLSKNLMVEHVCVLGSGYPSPGALVVLSEAAAELPNDQVAASLEATMTETNQGLDKHENLSHIVVVSEQWTVDNGLMTPTLKVKRAALDTQYAKQIESWLGAPRGVLFEA